MAAALPWIGLALTAAGTTYGVVSSEQSRADAQAQQAKQEAQAEQLQANQAQQMKNQQEQQQADAAQAAKNTQAQQVQGQQAAKALQYGTILTSPLGLPGDSGSPGAKTLLGQ